VTASGAGEKLPQFLDVRGITVHVHHVELFFAYYAPTVSHRLLCCLGLCIYVTVHSFEQSSVDGEIGTFISGQFVTRHSDSYAVSLLSI